MIHLEEAWQKAVSELTGDASTGGFPLIQLDLMESTELPNKRCCFVIAMNRARSKQAPAGINSARKKKSKGTSSPHSHPLFFFLAIRRAGKRVPDVNLLLAFLVTRHGDEGDERHAALTEK